MRRYARFLLMIATSMALMFFLMYLNSYRVADHFWFSETRLFMTLIMGAAMMVVMLSFMRGMYPSRTANAALYAAAAALFGLALYLVRSQSTVTDADYMEGMIPHHSIAILTSERARIADPRVRDLAGRIISAQQREIREMEWLIQDIRTNGTARTPEAAAMRPVPEFAADR
jgi:hypothetical protein